MDYGLVEIILGSTSDHDKFVKDSALGKILTNLGIPYKTRAISAHRNPDELALHCRTATQRGTRVFVAVAGMAAALPGAIAACTRGQFPVIGVALPAEHLDGMDALLAMTRMPPGRPVHTAGIGKPALENAAIMAAQILAIGDPAIRERLGAWLESNNKKPEYDL